MYTWPMPKKKTYAKVVMDCYVVSKNEPVVQDRPRPALPYSEDGLLIGTRHFGYLCKPNPMKSTTIRVVDPDTLIVGQKEVASGCVLL